MTFFIHFPSDAVVVFNPTEYTVIEDVGQMSVIIELLTSTGRQLEYVLNTLPGNATGEVYIGVAVYDDEL